jgi:hypothetical protein
MSSILINLIEEFNDKNNLMFSLHKNNGRIDNIRKFIPYKKDDNDFYWLNFPDKKHFYVFPQDILIKHGYVDSNRKHFKISSIKNKTWKSDYLFDYENLDEERLLNLFKSLEE